MSSVSPGRKWGARFPAWSTRAPVRLVRRAAAPLAGIAVFLLLWSAAAANIGASPDSVPGPAEVWRQALVLFTQESFSDQIRSSLVTVLSGFLLAALIAIPLGVALGLSRTLKSALNPLIQIFKPVSPLAWLSLVTLPAGAGGSTNAALSQPYLVSTITVALCCLWPMVISTGAGIASLNEPGAPTLARMRRMTLPDAAPTILAGMRQSLGIAWMVLAAVEMLAGNPGLGQFVGQEFRNGGSASCGRVMVALIAIGLIGCLLDRLMLASINRALGAGRLPSPGMRAALPLHREEAEGQETQRQLTH